MSGGGIVIYLTRMLPGRRKRGRSQRRFVDVVKRDMQTVGVAEENALEIG